MSRIVRFFPPLVTGTVITSIGMCLFPVAINWAGGGKGAEDFGSCTSCSSPAWCSAPSS